MISSKYIYAMYVLLMLCVGDAYAANLTDGADKKAIKQLYQEHMSISDREPAVMIEKWQEFISQSKSPELQIEARYYIGRIISAKESTDQYLTYVEEVVKSYSGDPHQLHYLYMLTTYAQVLAAPGDREGIFENIFQLINEGILFPVTGREGRSYKQIEDNVLRGSVWALLHEKTRTINGYEGRRNAASQLINDMADRPGGQEILPHIISWMESDKRRLNEATTTSEQHSVDLENEASNNKVEPTITPKVYIIRDEADKLIETTSGESTNQHENLSHEQAKEGLGPSRLYSYLSISAGILFVLVGYFRIRSQNA